MRKRPHLIGTVVGSRYRMRGVLGEGGMGTVYEAEHVGLGRMVAIKVLSASQAKMDVAVRRFQQEARTAGAIGHPNICEVYDLGSLPDGSPYLVMEKLVGQTLAERIHREGGLPYDEVVDVMSQVLSGLIAAHDKGIVHRDIKPENIFLARRTACAPIVKILDFGVSKITAPTAGETEAHIDLTRTGIVMGTPYYMSPEQARGERNLDGRVDVYACGIMMYEALVGRRPFLAPNYHALLLAILNTTPTPIRTLRPTTPPALEAFVTRAIAKDRNARFPSATHWLRELQAFALARRAGGSVGAPAARAPTPADPKRPPSLGALASYEDTRSAGPSDSNAPASLESFEVSVDLTTGTDLDVPRVESAPPPFVDEIPTEIFRSGKDASPPASPGRKPKHDDWDETLLWTAPPGPAPKAHAPPPPPFNPDETIRVDSAIDIVLFDDDDDEPAPK